jgi:hypothetical protein
MHYEKFKGKADVRRVLEHSDRGQEGVSEHEHSNDKIDPERSHLNYELKDRGGLSAVEYHRQRIEQIAEETKERTGKVLRKDAVTLCSWAVTAPQDLPEDKQEDFFRECYAWFSERYGEDNIVTAAVHLDETSPHMHLQFTPIIEDKDGTRRLCAKDLETRGKLKTVHQKLEKHLTKELGCKVTLLNGATANGNKTVNELKATRAADRAFNAEMDAKEKEKYADKLQSDINALVGSIHALKAEEGKLTVEVEASRQRASDARSDADAAEQVISQKLETIDRLDEEIMLRQEQLDRLDRGMVERMIPESVEYSDFMSTLRRNQEKGKGLGK